LFTRWVALFEREVVKGAKLSIKLFRVAIVGFRLWVWLVE